MWTQTSDVTKGWRVSACVSREHGPQGAGLCSALNIYGGDMASVPDTVLDSGFSMHM